MRDLTSPHPLIRHLLEEDEQRRLKVLNSLFLGLAKADYKAWLNDEDSRGTGVVVGASQVSFLLDHPKAERDRDYRYRTRSGPADALQLKLAGETVWADDKTTKLESHLTGSSCR